MARSSGRVGVESFRAGEFNHARSGIRYRMLEDQGRYFFEFSRAGEAMSGRRPLDFFIGSGAAGRSYLVAAGGFLFQAPVSWYAQQRRWDISPGFDGYETLNLSRPIEVACLKCHASRVQPRAATQNGYAETPFLEGGIACERCHGQGAAHAAGKTAEIVNPAKLGSRERDAVCAECHLTGQARVEKRDGTLVAFVWASAAESGFTVTSHYEKLWQSRCKKAAGDRLWCGTCHDPHAPPAASRRSQHFRQKCLECHPAAHERQRDRQDCIRCHMPAGPVLDVAHTVYTDHSIPRAAAGKRTVRLDRRLVPFWGGAAEPRELGLAYLEVAHREGNPSDLDRAFELLRQARAKGDDDPPLLTRLAFLYDRAGDPQQSAELYERALREDGGQVDAAVNLGSMLARRGQWQGAIELWQAALAANPGAEAAQINLALAHLTRGRREEARAAVRRALEFNPDLPAARKLLVELTARAPQR
jgi:hypothetical protein